MIRSTSLQDTPPRHRADPSFIVLATHKRSPLNRIRVDLALLAFFFLLGIAPLTWWGMATRQWFEPYADDLV